MPQPSNPTWSVFVQNHATNVTKHMPWWTIALRQPEQLENTVNSGHTFRDNNDHNYIQEATTTGHGTK